LHVYFSLPLQCWHNITVEEEMTRAVELSVRRMEEPSGVLDPEEGCSGERTSKRTGDITIGRTGSSSLNDNPRLAIYPPVSRTTASSSVLVTEKSRHETGSNEAITGQMEREGLVTKEEVVEDVRNMSQGQGQCDKLGVNCEEDLREIIEEGTAAKAVGVADSEKDDKSVKCVLCGLQLGSLDSLRKHKKFVHTNKCEYTFVWRLVVGGVSSGTGGMYFRTI
jgi:hypothetical protein